MKTYFLLFILAIPLSLTAQRTAEDSLAAGKESKAYIGGYGEVKVTYDTRDETAQANVERAVVFVGYRFNKNISFFSETELEDAKIEGGEPHGELALEQLYLKFDVGKTHYLTAGLFIPRIGIINENHLPTSYNGVNRPFVERYVIPTTWREIGIGWYGTLEPLGGLQYSLGVMNGLNSAELNGGSGLRGGRFGGQDATISNIAVTGSLLYYIKDLRLQASGYYGGSAGLNPHVADSLQLDSGPFGTPISLVEANAQYDYKALHLRALAAVANIPDAEKINRAYATNVPQTMMGWYAEAAVDVLYGAYRNEKKLLVFARYENLDINRVVPFNGIENPEWEQQYIIGGVNFQPVNGVSIKLDYVQRITGEPNPALVVTPFPQQQPYFTNHGFVNLGLGYSF